MLKPIPLVTKGNGFYLQYYLCYYLRTCPILTKRFIPTSSRKNTKPITPPSASTLPKRRKLLTADRSTSALLMILFNQDDRFTRELVCNDLFNQGIKSIRELCITAD